MSDHRISANGLSIECHAAADAECRQRVECNSESWTYGEGCDAHDQEHPTKPGGECWMIPWVNASDLEDSYHDPDAYPVTVRPGRLVELFNEVPEAVLWEYEEGDPR